MSLSPQFNATLLLLCLATSVSGEESVSEVPRITLWDIITSFMQSNSLAKTMPSLVTFVPNLLGGVLTNILELMIEYGKRFMDSWTQPDTSTNESGARSLEGGSLGGLFQWDILDTGLRLMRVRRSCRSKAACDCGSYLFHKNRRVARSLDTIRNRLDKVSIHWRALNTGLRGESCTETYPGCEVDR